MSVRDSRDRSPLSTLDDAIWRTIVYAGVFEYPLRLAELRRRLMDVAAEESEIAARLLAPPLRGRVGLCDDFVMPRGQERWVELRRARGAHTASLLERHRRALRILGRFPFVRMAALSGACAHGNATDDDVDVFLVTRASRAWLATLLIMVASKVAGLRRSLCVNYVVGEDGLALPEQDRFTAAEIVGLRPLAGGDTYQRFLRANGWIADRHPNFAAGADTEAEGVSARAGAPWVEALLEILGAALVERVARRLLGAYLRRRVQGRGVEMSARRLKLHAHDHRPFVSETFAAAATEGAPAEAEEVALTGARTA